MNLYQIKNKNIKALKLSKSELLHLENTKSFGKRDWKQNLKVYDILRSDQKSRILNVKMKEGHSCFIWSNGYSQQGLTLVKIDSVRQICRKSFCFKQGVCLKTKIFLMLDEVSYISWRLGNMFILSKCEWNLELCLHITACVFEA